MQPHRLVHLGGRLALVLSALLGPRLVLAAPSTPAASAAGYKLFLPALASGLELPAHPDLHRLDYEDFVASVSDGQAGVLRGVYAAGVLAERVVQQPAGDPGYIASAPGTVTEYQLASAFGNVGLLAHNTLSGAWFAHLRIGQALWLVDGAGQGRAYEVAHIYRFQAIEPNNPYSDLIDLDTGAQLNTLEVFEAVYGGSHHVTFQTCLARDGQPAWGRLFVIAEPAD